MNASETSSLSPDRAPVEKVRNKSPRRIVITLLIVLVVCGGVPTWLVFAFRAARESARCGMCENRLGGLAMGLQNFDLAHGGLPPAYLCDETGKPIHSWQSICKRYLHYYRWEEAYSMKEPWNGPNNGKLGPCGDHMFQCPTAGPPSRTTTDFVAVVGPDTMWPGRERVKLRGDEDTILLIEMPDSDYNSLEPRSPTVEEFMEKIKLPTGEGIRCIHPRGLAYVTVGGDVRWFPPDTDPETIRRLLKRDPKCEVVSLDKLKPLIKHWGEKGDGR
jgi:hypothetical protein